MTLTPAPVAPPPADLPDILCIGSVLWDVIGRAAMPMHLGADVPGRITRLPGGVAMNIAMALVRFGLRPAVLTAIGRDADGAALVAACARLGIDTGYAYLSDDLPTDRYMAIEGANGLIAAIADAHSLEQAGARILQPLSDGRLGSDTAPYGGTIALDGNLTPALLADLAAGALPSGADLRVAPASPGKAERLLPFLRHGRGTLYVNRDEAAILVQRRVDSAAAAATALIDAGAHRVLVTDGGAAAAYGDAQGVLTALPPQVMVTRVTGAGDTFMAAHIAAERAGADAAAALARALAAAGRYVSGEPPA